jgi:hypothetical protein
MVVLGVSEVIEHPRAVVQSSRRPSYLIRFLPQIDGATLAEFVRDIESAGTIEGNTYVMLIPESNDLDGAELGSLVGLRAYLAGHKASLRLIASPAQRRILAEAGFVTHYEVDPRGNA